MYVCTEYKSGWLVVVVRVEEGPSREAVSQVVGEGVRKGSRSQIPHLPVKTCEPSQRGERVRYSQCRAVEEAFWRWKQCR